MVCESDILKRVREIIAEIAMVSAEHVKEDSLLAEELGMESMEFVELQFELETAFGIEFYHGSALDKLAELLAPRKLEDGGLLTPFGAQVLQSRLPEVDAALISEGLPTAGIEAAFNPRTWVRAIKELLDGRPQSCPQCQSTALKVLKPAVLLCKSCSSEIACPKGEDMLVEWVEHVGRHLGEKGEARSARTPNGPS